MCGCVRARIYLCGHVRVCLCVHESMWLCGTPAAWVPGQLTERAVARIGRWHRLLAPECAVLTALGAHAAYEICVGLNGRVWMRAATPKQTVLVATAVQQADGLTPRQVAALVRDLVARFSS
jgi:hypothetical protein